MIDFYKLLESDKGSAVPVYRRIAEALREKIVSGELRAGTRLPTETELAAAFGVTRMTLRNALKILAEQKLLSQRQGSGTFVAHCHEEHCRIGVITENADAGGDDWYGMRMITALNRALSRTGSGELILLPDHFSGAGELMECFHHVGCSDLVIITTEQEICMQLCDPMFDEVRMVFVNCMFDMPRRANRYEVTLSGGSFVLALDYLKKQGHRQVAYLSRDLAVLERRNQEFAEAARLFDMKSELFIDNTDEWWYETAHKTAYKLCRSQERPDALVCPGMAFSCGAWQGVLEAGLRIPDDISLIGFDINHSSNPLMTSIEQPLDDMAAKALELLCDMREVGKHLKQRVYEFPATLSERGSCRRRIGV